MKWSLLKYDEATRLKVSLEKPFTKLASEKLSIERLISKRGRQTPGSIIQTISLKQKKNLYIYIYIKQKKNLYIYIIYIYIYYICYIYAYINIYTYIYIYIYIYLYAYC